jgi:hypothetical protein
MSRQSRQLSTRVGGQDDFEPHSGQSIARTLALGKVGPTLAIGCEAPFWPGFVSFISLLGSVYSSPNAFSRRERHRESVLLVNHWTITRVAGD